MDVSQYLEIFIDETKEHLQNLNTEILNLEQDPENVDTINEIFRAAHSLKGMAGTMGYKRMQTLTHDMENVFSEVRNGSIKVKGNMIDILFQCLDALEEYLNLIQESGDEGTNDNEPLIRQLNVVLNSKESPAPVEKKPEEPVKKEPVEEGDAPKWLSIKFDGTQKHVLQEAVNQGKNVYGLTVKVRPGFGMINGAFAYDAVESTYALEAAPAQNSRIDRMVLRCNYLERLCEIVVKTGTAATNPVPPALLQPVSGDYYELGLALVTVGANKTMLTQSAITDTRADSSVCGFVTQFIDSIDTEVFFAQFNAFYREFT